MIEQKLPDRGSIRKKSTIAEEKKRDGAYCIPTVGEAALS